MTQDSTDTDSTDTDWTEYNDIVIFRNDDPAPWTDIELLSAVNDLFIDHGVPLTQGIVPTDESNNEDLNPEHDVVEYLTGITEDNPNLFEHALHGHTHTRETDFFWGSEFGGLSYDQQSQKISDAVQTFESCFDREPTTFIAPYNTYDETTVEVLAEHEFTLVSGNYYFQKEHLGKEGVWEGDELIHLPVNLAMEDSDTQDVRELDELKQEFDTNKDEDGLNAIMLHYTRYAAEADRGTLDDLIQYAVQDESKFMTLGAFAEQLDDGSLRRTENGWRVNETPSTPNLLDTEGTGGGYATQSSGR